MSAFGRLPLAFEPNRGQARRGVAFIARGGGAVYELARQGVSVWMRGVRLNIRFAGATGGRGLRGEGALGGHANYFFAHRSMTGIPLYGAVTLSRVSPGVDVHFHGAPDGALEFDYLIAPGADAGRIGFTLSGERRLAASSHGGLTAVLRRGQLDELRPFAYQWRRGRRVAVPSRYVGVGGGRVRIALGRYDHARELIVDPKLVYSTYFGGARDASLAGIAVDRQGDSYLAGGIASADGSSDPTYRPAFVAKLNPAGTRVIYLNVIDGLHINGIGVDREGDAYIAGDAAAGLRTTPGAFQRTLPQGRAPRGYPLQGPFVAKLSPDGSRLLYATYLAGTPSSTSEQGQEIWSGGGSPTGIAVDGAGHAFVVGITTSAHFPVRNAYQPTYQPQQFYDQPVSNFLSELTPDGRTLLYSTYLGGDGPRVAASPNGTVFVAGETAQATSPTRRGFTICPKPTVETFGRHSCAEAAFVSAFRPRRRGPASLLYTTLLGSSNIITVRSIAADRRGDAFVTGKAYASDFPTTPGAYLRSYAPLSFVSELAPRGRRLVYSTFVESGDASSIAVNAHGEAFITGTAKDVRRRRDALRGSTVIAADRRPDAHLKLIYVLGVGPRGRTLRDVTYIGEDGDSTDPQSAVGIATGPHGDLFIAAEPGSSQFPVTTHAYQRHSRGPYDSPYGANPVVFRLTLGPH